MVSQDRKNDIAIIADKIHHIVMSDNIDNENLATYLRSVNIGVFSSNLNDTNVDAYITYNHEKARPEIYLDSSENKRRQVFSMAHELGHLVLHWKFIPNIKNEQKLFLPPNPIKSQKESILMINYRRQDTYTSEQSELEYEANYFAADFLVPEDNVIDFLETYQGLGYSDAELIKRLKVNYFISDDTARIKLENLRKFMDI